MSICQNEVLSEESQLMKWVGIFRGEIFQVGVWWVGIFMGGIFLEPPSINYRSYSLDGYDEEIGEEI